MKLEKIVVNLELSKKLWEAGLRVDSCFRYYEDQIRDGEKFWRIIRRDHFIPEDFMGEWCVPAPTATEILEWLAKKLDLSQLQAVLILQPYLDHKKNVIRYRAEYPSVMRTDDTPQDALAKLVLWVLEQK